MYTKGAKPHCKTNWLSYQIHSM